MMVSRHRRPLHHHTHAQGRTLSLRTRLHCRLECLLFLQTATLRHVPEISYVTVSHVRGG
jgi:hypothetical protein